MKQDILPILSLRNILTSAISTAIFVILFAVIYRPTFGHHPLPVDMWQHASLCIPISAAIVLVVMLVSRFLCRFYVQRNDLSLQNFRFWKVGEVAVSCLFVALFLSLFFHTPYFEILPATFLVGALVLILPFIYWLIRDNNIVLKQHLLGAQQQIEQMNQSADRTGGSNAIRFTDEKGQVRLVVTAEHIFYIESASNYVNIIYDDDGRLRRFALRNTLKALEEICAANRLVRCHRSYFINLARVKLLRRDGEYLFAKIDADGVDDIPVSKTYASEVVRLMG